MGMGATTISAYTLQVHKIAKAPLLSARIIVEDSDLTSCYDNFLSWKEDNPTEAEDPFWQAS